MLARSFNPAEFHRPAQYKTEKRLLKQSTDARKAKNKFKKCGFVGHGDDNAARSNSSQLRKRFGEIFKRYVLQNFKSRYNIKTAILKRQRTHVGYDIRGEIFIKIAGCYVVSQFFNVVRKKSIALAYFQNLNFARIAPNSLPHQIHLIKLGNKTI